MKKAEKICQMRVWNILLSSELYRKNLLYVLVHSIYKSFICSVSHSIISFIVVQILGSLIQPWLLLQYLLICVYWSDMAVNKDLYHYKIYA